MNNKKALITGITGQDGAYLSKFLLDSGYEVHGVLRRSASSDVVNSRLKWLGTRDKITWHDGNLIDLSSLVRIIKEVQPSEVYNLAAQSFVKSSWQQPILTGEVTGIGAVNMLEAVRLCVRKRGFIKHPLRKCSACGRKRSNPRRRRFIRARLTRRPSSTPTG